MLTQAQPAVIQALMNALPPNAIKALTQAIGNCQQPLTHRGPVTVEPTTQGNNKGMYNNATWNPNDYRNILPTASQAGGAFVDLPGFSPGGSYHAGDWNSTNYGGSNFSFPTDDYFNTTDFYGGNTFNVAGNSSFNNLNVQNINVSTINNQTPVTGGSGGGGFSTSQSPSSGWVAGAGGFPGGDGSSGWFGGSSPGGDSDGPNSTGEIYPPSRTGGGYRGRSISWIKSLPKYVPNYEDLPNNMSLTPIPNTITYLKSITIAFDPATCVVSSTPVTDSFTYYLYALDKGDSVRIPTSFTPVPSAKECTQTGTFLVPG